MSSNIVNAIAKTTTLQTVIENQNQNVILAPAIQRIPNEVSVLPQVENLVPVLPQAENLVPLLPPEAIADLNPNSVDFSVVLEIASAFFW